MNRAGKLLSQRFPGETFSAAELADFLSVVGCVSVAPGRVGYQEEAARWRRILGSVSGWKRSQLCYRHAGAIQSAAQSGAVELPQ